MLLVPRIHKVNNNKLLKIKKPERLLNLKAFKQLKELFLLKIFN